MQKNSLSYAKYWRSCLADADLFKGAFKKVELANLIWCDPIQLQNGIIGADLTRDLFNDIDDTVNKIEITIRPYIYYSRFENGKSRIGGLPEVVTPVVSQAILDRKGRIYPNLITVVPRDILEPIGAGSFSIGSVADLDNWLTGHKMPFFDFQTDENGDQDQRHFAHWQAYLNYCEEMLGNIAPKWPDDETPFVMDDRWCIIKNSDVLDAGKYILRLYDYMRSQDPPSLLFDRYASEKVETPEPCHPKNYGFSLRLAHSSDTYPLSDAQRDSLTHQLVSKEGDILGVNGPPGTGKTTLLLSVVATHWARAALNGGDPPVIVATSANNQAVTNVIDAFEKDFSTGTGPFAGRWLPDIKSFGSYFLSENKKRQFSEKYQTDRFFDALESEEYFHRAKAAFLGSACAAFPDLIAPSVEDIRDQLQELIKGAERHLSAIEAAWPPLPLAIKALNDELGASPEQNLAALHNAVSTKLSELSTFKRLMEKWEEFQGSESWLYTLLSWLPPVNKKRILAAKTFLRSVWPETFPDRHWTDVEQFTGEIQTHLNRIDRELAEQQTALQRGKMVTKNHQEAVRLWANAIGCLEMTSLPEKTSLAECDKVADTVIRFPAFLYSTHYWEARWLIQLEKLLPSLVEEKAKRGALVIQKRWRRRMMLTPCAVSTLFMLPNLFEASRYELGSYAPNFLFGYVDLLIVDEAGQVLPEVAGASFSLAKRALVIGDVFQIEPIWKITTQVDIGNMNTAGILRSMDDRHNYNRIAGLGKSAGSGSVMKIAQYATRYHYDKDLSRGMFLYEHRRCYDEIVAYCNALIYHNKLVPKRGPRGAAAGLPAMGYLHVEGKCERHGSSRVNPIEAETIAAWIADNQIELEQKYKKPISEIIAVIAPFSGQVGAIIKACTKRGIRSGKGEGGITVGTVHALQGSERLVVIFSPTYSQDADGGFMDRSPNMLNVGVSRARDNFLVFGDMSLFKQCERGTPRALLASFLFAKEGNALTFAMETG